MKSKLVLVALLGLGLLLLAAPTAQAAHATACSYGLVNPPCVVAWFPPVRHVTCLSLPLHAYVQGAVIDVCVA